MNYPCDNCVQNLSCIFDFGFYKCGKYAAWLGKPLSGEEKAEEQQTHINEEWAEHIRKRFERVE